MPAPPRSIYAMSLTKSLAISFCFFASVFTKPLKGSFAPRQEATPTAPPSADSTACGDIIVAVKNEYTLFGASSVYECLQSVPFNPAIALQFLDYYSTTLQFQSTLGYHKSPPQGYQWPAIDVDQALEAIKQNVTAGVYKNQYEFEAQLQLLTVQFRDTHVSLNGGALSAFSFINPYGLISASVDGKQVPEIYLDEYFQTAKAEGKVPSPIVQINGEDVIDYLTRFAERNSLGYLEPHADWNSLMENPSMNIQGYLSLFQSTRLYPGDEKNGDAIIFTLKDGTKVEDIWWAYCVDCEETGPLTTGGDFYNYFVLGFLPESYNETDTWWPILPEEETEEEDTTEAEPTSPPVCLKGTPAEQNWCDESLGAYPNDPFVAQDELTLEGAGVVTGYMLKDISTAILSIPTFVQTGNNALNFRKAVQDFIGNATQAGISRVVIDLQQNSGGLNFLAYDTFKQFFPDQEPRDASRIRSHKNANILGSAYTEWWDRKDTDQDSYSEYAAIEWVATNRINAATGNNFSSWAEYFGPESSSGGDFSLAQRYNLSNEMFDHSAFRYIPWGYDSKIPMTSTTPPWSAENIVLLTDGLCGSTCALFTELMTHEAGVRTLTVGGRPVKGPMQAVSGTRGASVYSADSLDLDILGLSDELTVNNPTAAASLPNRTETGMWINYAGFTIRNQVRENDPTPLHFQYQAADCRIYYTLANIYNLTQLWHDTARAAWDDESFCVEDSTGYPTARGQSSAKPPPAVGNSVQTLAFDLDNIDLSEFALTANATFELHNGDKIPRAKGEIIKCGPGDSCAVGECQPMSFTCSDGSEKTKQSMCPPKCDPNKVEGTGCAKGQRCVPTTTKSSKKNVATKGKGPAKPKKNGFCTSDVGTVKMGCPRPVPV
ncbi:hypothetical protein BDV95DRAFT_209640 [Massariosphaeria phaeospora]|uniref:CPAF-like PDZ domain-containing protein n=1 Tax=Massariosphaeria phaeospora TaxID=100035 RepID=A0A7C8M8B2_9PLEO|nr:hypothetical protein BDV95DRAFT_209640 [Massariosphaeria phaeospora]